MSFCQRAIHASQPVEASHEEFASSDAFIFKHEHVVGVFLEKEVSSTTATAMHTVSAPIQHHFPGFHFAIFHLLDVRQIFVMKSEMCQEFCVVVDQRCK